MGAHALPAPVDDRGDGAERDRERAASPARRQAFDTAWVKILQKHLGAWKHAEFGLGTSLMQAQRYGYTQMINNATLTNSSYKLRLAQDITLYLAEIGMDIDGLGRRGRQEAPGWRTRSGRAPARRSRPSWAATDYLEQYFATNLVFEPLVGELFRSGFLMQVAAANDDFITPSVISAAEADYERNLANTIDLDLPAGQRRGARRRTTASCSRAGSTKHGALADKAAAGLQPIWSQPHSKPRLASTTRAADIRTSGCGKILGELGLTPLNERTDHMSAP